MSAPNPSVSELQFLEGNPVGGLLKPYMCKKKKKWSEQNYNH